MARIDAYTYYLSTYGQSKPNRYDSHKRSDLRKVYTSMVRTNQQSPLYKLTNEDAAAKYAIDIKENAKAIQNVVATLSDTYGDFQDSFRKKVAISSDESSVGVRYVGDGTETDAPEHFSIEVKHLASPQMNTGSFLKDDALSITPGTYSFDLSVNSTAYEFQFNVSQGETNLDVIKKLANLFNRSSLGIHATIQSRDGEAGRTSALQLTSHQLGRNANGSDVFEITPGPTAESIQAVERLGIQHISNHAQNAEFLLDGEPFQSLSNVFHIGNSFELSLNAPSPQGTPAEISFKTNIDAIADNIMSLVDAFNNILKIAENATDEATGESNKLLLEIRSISKSRKSAFAGIGLEVAENGRISLNKEQLEIAVTPDQDLETFNILSRFKNAVGAKADDIAINPMKYVNKVIVNYKNPGRTFVAPYFSSIYSGMMLDRYV